MIWRGAREHAPRRNTRACGCSSIDNAPSDDVPSGSSAARGRAGGPVRDSNRGPGSPGHAIGRSTRPVAKSSPGPTTTRLCDPLVGAEIARAFVEVPAAGCCDRPGRAGRAGDPVPSALRAVQRRSPRARIHTDQVFSPATAAPSRAPYIRCPRSEPGPIWLSGATRSSASAGSIRALGTGTVDAGRRGHGGVEHAAAGRRYDRVPAQRDRLHRHRRDYAALQRVMLGYGRGLSALLREHGRAPPRLYARAARLSRRVLRDQIVRRRRPAPRRARRASRSDSCASTARAGCKARSCIPCARMRARRLAGESAGS